MSQAPIPTTIFPIYNKNNYKAKTTVYNMDDYLNKNSLSTQIISGSLSAPSLTTESLTFLNDTTQSSAFTQDHVDSINSLIDESAKTTNISYDDSLLKTSISNNCYIENVSFGNINVSHLNNTTSNLQTQINNTNIKLTKISYDSDLLKTSISNDCYIANATFGNFNSSYLTGMTSNIQSQINTLSSSGVNSTLTEITYDSNTKTTSIANNTNINNLTCGNINTSHLSGTSSNLQSQINNLGIIYTYNSPDWIELDFTGSITIPYNIPKGVYNVITYFQLRQKTSVSTNQWNNTTDYMTINVAPYTITGSETYVFPAMASGCEYKMTKTGLISRTSPMQLQLENVHVLQGNTNPDYTTYQKLSLAYTLNFSGYKLATTQDPSSPDYDPIALDPNILATITSIKPECKIFMSYLRVAN